MCYCTIARSLNSIFTLVQARLSSILLKWFTIKYKNPVKFANYHIYYGYSQQRRMFGASTYIIENKILQSPSEKNIKRYYQKFEIQFIFMALL